MLLTRLVSYPKGLRMNSASLAARISQDLAYRKFVVESSQMDSTLKKKELAALQRDLALLKQLREKHK